MSKPTNAILKAEEMPSISRGGGASTTHVVTPACGAGSFLNGFTDIPPGMAIPMHYHNCEESVLIVEGRATVDSNGQLADAKKGDVVWQPANFPHRFINPSKTETLRIYWTYASINANRTLVETGETGPILSEGGNRS